MRGYLVYMIIMTVFALPVLIVPILAPSNPSLFTSVQQAYAPTCHQLTSRSICWFPSKMTFDDCIKTTTLESTKQSTVEQNEAIGYKLPVCARDVGIYLFMFIGGIAVWINNGKDTRVLPPAIWLILALIPIGIDGTGQFLGYWESTNTMRLITGAIAGFAMPFYIIPMLNSFLDKKDKLPKETKFEKLG